MDAKFNMDEAIEYIRRHTPLPSLYEMAAEEAIELAHATLKAARVLRRENPTPVTLPQACCDVEEELSDLTLALKLLEKTASLRPDEYWMQRKAIRWIERLEEKDE